jgi:hypothetical protein
MGEFLEINERAYIPVLYRIPTFTLNPTASYKEANISRKKKEAV